MKKGYGGGLKTPTPSLNRGSLPKFPGGKIDIYVLTPIR